MNISEEKAYIYNMMRDITSERRALTDLYFQLKERLEKLDELEMRGLTDIDVKGYIELTKEHDKRLKELNLERELKHVQSNLTEQNDNEVIPKHEVSESKFQDKVAVRRRATVPQERANVYISEVLKEAGVPVNLTDLFEAFNKRAEEDGYASVTRKNFRNNIMQRLKKMNDRIESASRGYYQYRL